MSKDPKPTECIELLTDRYRYLAGYLVAKSVVRLVYKPDLS
jgi:hypothetical protein